MKIFVKNMKLKSTTEYEVDSSETIESVISKIRSQSGSQDDSTSEYTLAYKGKKLSPDASLSSANVLADSTLVLMVKLGKKTASSTTTSSTSTSTGKPSSPSEPAEPPKQCLDPACSFYGSKDNDGYCSVCYKKKFGDKKKEEPKKHEAPETPSEPTTTTTDSSTPVQQDTTKCWKCNRNVGLLGFNCQCKYVFCAKHRYGDKHNCTFDYKAREQSKLDKDLQKVVGGKLNPIS